MFLYFKDIADKLANSFEEVKIVYYTNPCKESNNLFTFTVVYDNDWGCGYGNFVSPELLNAFAENVVNKIEADFQGKLVKKDKMAINCHLIDYDTFEKMVNKESFQNALPVVLTDKEHCFSSLVRSKRKIK